MRGYPILNYSEGRVWFDLNSNRPSGIAWIFLKAKQPDGRFGFNTNRYDYRLGVNTNRHDTVLD